MRKKARTDERTRVLRRLRRRHFSRYIFVGQDALTVRVPEGGSVRPAVQARFGGRSMRIYPVAGGHVYRWPRAEGEAAPPGFEVEAGGWDHEHCDACDRTLKRDGSVWLTTHGSFVQLCPYCYRRVQQLAAESAPADQAGRRR